jgi:hypothetical protein
LNFFIRASNCGALTEYEILEATNLTLEELHLIRLYKLWKTARKLLKAISENGHSPTEFHQENLLFACGCL